MRLFFIFLIYLFLLTIFPFFLMFGLLPGLSFCAIDRWTRWVCAYWVRAHRSVIHHLVGTPITIEHQGDPLDSIRSCFLVANHQTWLDILMIEYLNLPVRRYFIKKSLHWVPWVGWVCLALRFPSMNRTLKGYAQDIKTTQKACNRLASLSFTLVNFVESTRCTPDKLQRSAYRHILDPKSGMLWHSIQQLGPKTPYLIDMSIAYRMKDISQSPSLIAFYKRKMHAVRIRLRVYTLEDGWYQTNQVQQSKRAVHQWLLRCWKEKDEWMEYQKTNPHQACTKDESE